jgi:hypothetical protein
MVTQADMIPGKLRESYPKARGVPRYNLGVGGLTGA